MIPPTFYIVGGALLAGALGGWTVRDWKADSDALAAVVKTEKIRDQMQGKIDDAATKYEQGRANDGPAQIETRNTIREIYRDGPPIPVECSVPDAVAVVLDAARQRANAATTGQSGAVVPPTATDAPQRP